MKAKRVQPSFQDRQQAIPRRWQRHRSYLKYAFILSIFLLLAACGQPRSGVEQPPTSTDELQVLATGSLDVQADGISSASLASFMAGDLEVVSVSPTTLSPVSTPLGDGQLMSVQAELRNRTGRPLNNVVLLAVAVGADSTLSPFSNVRSSLGAPVNDPDVLASIKPAQAASGANFVAYAETDLSDDLYRSVDDAVTVPVATLLPYGFYLGDGALADGDVATVHLGFIVPDGSDVSSFSFHFVAVEDSQRRTTQGVNEVVLNGNLQDTGYSSARARYMAATGDKTIVLIGSYERVVSQVDINAGIFTLLPDIRIMGSSSNPTATLFDSGTNDVARLVASSTTSSASADFMFRVNGAGTVTTTTDAGTDFQGSAVTQGADERQLRSGLELAVSDVQLVQTAGRVQFLGTFTNAMPGFALNSLSLELEAVDTNGQLTRQSIQIDPSTWANEVLLADDATDVSVELDLSGELDSLNIRAFGDVANHYIVNPNPPVSSQQVQWNTPNYARTGADLANYVNNASYADVVTFARGVSEFELSEPLTVNTLVNITARQNRLTSEFDRVTLKPASGFADSMIEVVNGDLVMSGITLQGGTRTALINYGITNLQAVNFVKNVNRSGSFGGAIRNYGFINIYRDRTPAKSNNKFLDNVSTRGGAIYNEGTIHWEDGLIFLGNSAEYGGAIYNEDAAIIKKVGNRYPDFENNFIGNEASTHGGAIYNEGEMELRDTLFRSNHADDYGGAIRNDARGDLTVEGGHFEANTAQYGGAIFNSGVDMDIFSSTFTQNVAQRGVALYTCGPKVLMRTSLVYNNDFKDDGVLEVGLGVYISGTCPVVRSRIHSSGHTHNGRNNGSAQLELHGVTIWNNNGVEGQYGTGIYLANGASVDVTSSIIAMNQGGDSFMSDIDADDPAGVSFSSTNSFYSVMDKFPLGSGDIGSEDYSRPLDPNLTPDAQGRPVPSPSSLVVNAGVCDGSSTDIRGEARQTGASCDMGAIELTASELQAVSTILEITGIGPVIENSTPADAATVSVIDPYVHIYGQAGTQGLTELRYSLNYEPLESYDLNKLIRNGGAFQLDFFYMGIYEARALRRVADGLNTIYVEATYADGTRKQLRYDFLVLKECLRGNNNACVGTINYSAGTVPTFSANVDTFVWWDVNPTTTRNISVIAAIEPITDFVNCGGSCPLDVFSYRVNDAPAVQLTETQINASLQDIDNDGTAEYVFEIALSDLPTGRNGVVIGTLYGGVRVHNTVLHFDVQ